LLRRTLVLLIITLQSHLSYAVLSISKNNNPMKHIFFCILFITPIIANCQSGNIEKSKYGVQTGFLGVWFQNERRVSNTVALRLELGLDASFFSAFLNQKTRYVLGPVLTVEPRYYYNLEKRKLKGKSIANNSGNFLSVKTSYTPNWFAISNYDNVKAVQNISMIPTFGIRRHIGNHFNYEAGFGYGYRYYFDNSNGNKINEGEFGANLLLRLGYTF
jgi:hypothetical protein